jgi:hypothetical protein
MLAPWTSFPLSAIIGGTRRFKRRSGKMLRPLLRNRSTSAATKRTGLPKSILGLAIAVALLATLGVYVTAASSQNQAAVKAFHGTKDCSGFTGLVGAYCTIRSSNVRALKVGSKIFYVQEAGTTGLDSDTIIYVKQGRVATGHCVLRSATGTGLCTISGGTGTLAGFRLRVRVRASSSVPKLWHWDGTYSFNRG